MARELSLTEKAGIVNTPGGVIFPCPQCGEYEIVRSKKERQTVVKYKCPKGGFEGPN